MKGINHRLCKSMSRRNSQCHGVVAGARLSSRNSEEARVRGTETESEGETEQVREEYGSAEARPSWTLQIL